MAAEVPTTILLDKLQKMLLVLAEERFIFPGLKSRVGIAVNELKQILSFLELEIPSSTALKAPFLPTVHCADYITESFLLTTLQRRRKGVTKFIKTPLMAFPPWTQLLFSLEMKKVVKSFRAISCEFAKTLELANKTHDLSIQVSALEEELIHLEPDVLVGREDLEKELVARLIHDNKQSLRVISLVSKEPLGKTALARKVYDRLDIRQHFQCRVWLRVPRDLEDHDRLLIIIKQILPRDLKNVELMDDTQLTYMLYNILMELKFLIVLDDVCSVDDWTMLVRSFPDTVNGSRVILTTRDINIASEVDPWSCPLELSPLTNEQSWELFLKKVRRQENSSDLNSFKDEILRICHGLPPSIVLLGGLLITLESSEWSKVTRSDPAHFGEDLSPLLHIVGLSYHRLPSVLKPCFLYLALFPKGYEIPTRRLLLLWLAEGFVQMSPKAGNVPEDVAKKYLEELIRRNVIEIARWKSDGSPKTCRLPFFLYDVFLPKAEEIGFVHIHHCGSDCTYADSSESSIWRFADQFGVKSISKSHIQHLCSYVSFEGQKRDISNREIGMVLNRIISKGGFILLKVLDLEGVYKPLLPENLGKLQNLRYLGLRWTCLHSCPVSIGDLPCLETLDMKYTNITTLPSSIWMAKNLRHLYMNGVSIKNPSKGSSTSLQTLMGLHIGSNESTIHFLDRFTSLRKLGLTFQSKSMKCISVISRLGNLQSLRLRSRDPFGQPSDLELKPLKEHSTLSNLYLLGVIKDDIHLLPQKLEILTLSLSGLKEDPMSVLGKLPRLNTLRLFAGSYVGSKMTCPALQHFPVLRVLKLWSLEELKECTVEQGAMPQLVELEIRGCKKLEKTDGLEHLPALKELILTNMTEDFVADVRRRLGRDKLISRTLSTSHN
uniref:NB-ARC domain-containing protein n=2 Tax=Quercus lobata TaxID=97700 RepID=A0A7N2L5V1_QUELO